MRILFVDDEPRVLEGLERSFFSGPDDWEIATAVGGAAALRELEEEPFDVIVTDMRMPGMSGVELLQQVYSRYPTTVRIVLSGQADRDAILSVLPIAHRFLAKPCPVARIASVIEETATLRHLLCSPGLCELVGRIRTLPSVPKVYRELSVALEDERSGAREVAAIVQRDPAITARILQVASSAFFGATSVALDPEQAVVRLGTDMVRAITLAAGMFAESPPDDVAGISLAALQQEALAVAEIAHALAPAGQLRARAFTAALLSDVGLLVLLCEAPVALAAIRARSGNAREQAAAERAELGATHAEVGAYLLGMWGLPGEVVDAVAHYLEPSTGSARATVGAREVLHVAMAIHQGFEPDLAYLEGLGAHDLVKAWHERRTS
ncbi:MAG: HDOD domain-containing protein [Sandaracinaceae bacterium]